MELIDLIVRLLTGFISVFFFGYNSAVSEPVLIPEPTVVFSNAQGEAVRSVTTIYSVEVLVMESFPMQLQLQIAGEHPDGCELPVIVEQQHEGNTVTVEIYRELPGDVFCPMMLQPYEGNIQVDGNFEPGDYVIKVNDFVVEVTL